MLPVPKNIGVDPQVKRLSVKDWLSGTVTAFDDGRTPLQGLKSAGNVYLTQDGTVRPRPSLVRYGPQPTGKILGEIFEYKKVSGTTRENWLICMQSFGVSISPSSSASPSSSVSPSASASASGSPSLSPSASLSRSPSSSASPSSSLSPSSSVSQSLSPSSSASISSSASPSASVSPSPSNPPTGHGQIFIARPEDASWTAVTGKYYDDEAPAHFFQIAGKVVIMNGVDTLSYMTITSATITAFNSISTPSAPTLNTINTITTGAFPITYRVSINSTVGETAASTTLATSANKDRDNWSGSENIVINLPAIGSGASFNIYCGVVGNFEYLIASSVSSAATTFTDTGGSTMPQDFTRLYPSTNSTGGPKVTRGTNISGRAFLVGDVDSPYKVWFGGDTAGNELDFSPANDGGYELINNGGKELPVAVKQHRDGKGTATIKVYCNGTYGKRFSMVPDSVTVGSDIITFFDVTEDEGEAGTTSPDAIIHYNNSEWYPSSDGFKTDGTQPQIQNVLTTKRTSNTIQPDIKLLNQSAMDVACGIGFEGRLYYALPVSSDTNNEIWILDLDRKGAWMKPWSITCDWMLLSNDNMGNTHHLILSDNSIYALSYSALSTDDGVPFQTNGQSGEVYFSDDKRLWVQLLQVIFVLNSPKGEVNFQVTGKTEDAALQGLGNPTTFTATSTTTVAGWGEVNESILGWGRNRWSKVGIIPTSSSQATQEIIIEVDETVQWASYSWSSTKAGVDYNLSDVIYEYIEVGLLDLA